jgi:hypothetical protein
MLMNDLHMMQQEMARYRHFSECIVEDVKWSDYGTTITVTLDYIWHSDGTLRDDTDDRMFVSLCFRMVQELQLHNQLRREVLAEPEVIDWGHAEIACLSLEANDQYTQLPMRFYDAKFEREKSTWIRVVFSEMGIGETLRSSMRSPG